LTGLFPILFPGADLWRSFLGIAGNPAFAVILASCGGAKKPKAVAREKRFSPPPDGSILSLF
jgi:hypothetical protein